MREPSPAAFLGLALLVGVLAACRPAAGEAPAEAPRVALVDIAAERGLRLPVASGGADKGHIRSTVGQGACWIDHDADGDADLFMPSGAREQRDRYAAGDPALVPWRFYVRNGERFVESARRLGLDVPAWGVGCAVGDVDGDGFDDLFVTTATGPDRLLRNRGGKGFEEFAHGLGAGGEGFSTGAVFLDADGDADLDLFVTTYLDEGHPPPGPCLWRGRPVTCGPNGFPQGASRLFLNDGAGRFRRSLDAGVEASRGYGLGVLSLDADEDGLPDLFVANDSSPNHLFLNRGGGRFEEAGFLAGVALSDAGTSQAGMGVDSGDVDGDGHADLVVTNFADDVHNLYRFDSPGLYSEWTHRSGLAGASFSTLGWAPILEDFDLDGDLDLFLTNGHVYPQAGDEDGAGYRQPLQLLINDGGGRFVPVEPAGAALSTPRAARGAAPSDIDGDGDVDLLVVLDGEAPLMLRNDLPAPGARWVKVELEGVGSNREGLGARVRVVAGGREQTREMRRGRGYLSTTEAVLVFGLGDAEEVSRLEITWPHGGGTQECMGLAAGATWRIHQGGPCPTGALGGRG